MVWWTGRIAGSRSCPNLAISLAGAGLCACATPAVSPGPPAQAPQAVVDVPAPADSDGTPEEDLVELARCTAIPRPPKQIGPVKKLEPSADDPLSGRFHMQQALDGMRGGFPLVATMETTHGTLRCELWDQVAPITVANFVGLARGIRPFRDPESKRWVSRPAYDGVIFHRIIAGFVIQGGDPSGVGTGEPGYRIPDEIDKSVGAGTRGTLFMANQGPDSNGMQFFIVHEPAPHLAGRYTAFGQCGPSDVIDRIATVPASGKHGRPDSPPVIHRVRIALDGPCE